MNSESILRFLFASPGGISITVIVCLAAAVLVLWYYEARVFLVLFQFVFFRKQKGENFVRDIENYLPDHKNITRAVADIRSELYQFIDQGLHAPRAHEVDAYNTDISSASGPAWRTLYLKVYNGWFYQNTQYFPITSALLAKMPEVNCIMFSIMEAGNTIPPHRGMMRGILRYQLPLHLSPEGRCTIKVNDETRQYRLGEPLLFDDNYLHTVSNNTNDFRAILFLDIQKPASSLVKKIDNFFMKLVQLSPRFRQARVEASVNA